VTVRRLPPVRSHVWVMTAYADILSIAGLRLFPLLALFLTAQQLAYSERVDKTKVKQCNANIIASASLTYWLAVDLPLLKLDWHVLYGISLAECYQRLQRSRGWLVVAGSLAVHCVYRLRILFTYGTVVVIGRINSGRAL